MDYTFLPGEVRQLLDGGGDGAGCLCIRGCGAFNSMPGESYLVFDGERLCFFDRGFGGEFNSRAANLADIDKAGLESEQFSATLNIHAGGECIEMKLSSAEKDNAARLVENFQSLRGDAAAEPVANPGAKAEEMSASALLGAALMFVAGLDGDIHKSELEVIRRVCSFHPGAFDQAHEYYQKHRLEELYEELSLTPQQALCYYANMLELAMADGVLDRNEQQLLRQFAGIFGVSHSDCESIRSVLLIKNQLSVLD